MMGYFPSASQVFAWLKMWPYPALATVALLAIVALLYPAFFKLRRLRLSFASFVIEAEFVCDVDKEKVPEPGAKSKTKPKPKADRADLPEISADTPRRPADDPPALVTQKTSCGKRLIARDDALRKG